MNITGLASEQNLGALVALQWTDKGEDQLPALRMCRNVTDVDLAGNRLKALPELQTLKFLRKLSLARNGIKELWDLPARLEHLNLSGNELQEVRLSLPVLKTVDLSCNQLTALTYLRTPSLTSLYASHNAIACIPALAQLTHLVEVDLEANLLDVQAVSALLTLPTLAVLNLRANPELADLTPPEEWIQDANLLFYRQPGRLKELKSSRFKRTIKRTQASFEAAYHQSLSPRANSGRQRTAGDIFEELIERCGITEELRALPPYSLERYVRAADRIVDCAKERETLRNALNAAQERVQCQACDLESVQLRQESSLMEPSFRVNLAMYEDLSSAPARVHCSSDRGQIHSNQQLFEVPRTLGSYIEKLKSQNAKLREALSRVRSQRDRNAVLLRTKLET